MEGVVSSRAPHAKARLAGILYLVSAMPAGFSVWVFSKLVVRGDPAASAAHVLASEGLFRAGFVADLVGILFFIAAVLLLYELFEVVNPTLAKLSLLFNLMGAVIQSLEALQDLAALMLLKGGPTFALATDQARTLAFLFLRLHTLGYILAMLFYGSASGLIGWLILRSTFLPRILGVLMIVDGLGYIAFSLANLLAPPLAMRLYPFLPFGTAIIGELSLIVWLIVKGVSSERWERQAGMTGVA
jgi:Domain of unknown function (DUF4386)